MSIIGEFEAVLVKYELLTAFVFVGLVMLASYWLSDRLTRGSIHGSAVAITAGLGLAYWAGVTTGGSQGVADITLLSGVGLLGGAMFRDFAIIATAYGADLEAIRRGGIVGAASVVIGVVLSFLVGAVVAVSFGYTDPIDVTTIGAGAVTYIVGPVTGTALGASSEIVVLSVGAGLVKSVLVMVGTPLVANKIGLNNPVSAMVYGGLMGTTSGVAGGLAATDPRLVPYGAMTATFYTGAGCLLAPSILFLAVRLFI
jgi:malonate transporter MadM subunit